MDANMVRARIDELMYAVQFDKDLADSARLEFVANSIRDQRHFCHPASEYSDAIAAVLDDSRLPAGVLATRHDDADILNWLRRLRAQMAVPSGPSTPGS